MLIHHAWASSDVTVTVWHARDLNPLHILFTYRVYCLQFKKEWFWLFLDVEGRWCLKFGSCSDTISANLYCHQSTHGRNHVAHRVQHKLCYAYSLHLSQCDTLFPLMDFISILKGHIFTLDRDMRGRQWNSGLGSSIRSFLQMEYTIISNTGAPV